MNPDTKQFERITDENKDRTRDWTKFTEGELVYLKSIAFYVHEVGESRLILKPVK